MLAAAGLFVAAAIGVPRLAGLTPARKIAVAVAAAAAALLALVGGINVHEHSTPRGREDAARIRRALDLIPPGAAVAASIVFEPHLSHRVALYALPEPFIPIDWGGSSTPAELAKKSRGVRYVVFISGGGPLEYPHRMRNVPSVVLRDGFSPIYRDGPVVVLERAK